MLVVFPPIFNFVTPLDDIYMCLTIVTKNTPLRRSELYKKEEIENGMMFCFVTSLTNFFKSTELFFKLTFSLISILG